MDVFQSGEIWALASGLLWAVGVVLFARAGEQIPPLPLNLFKDIVSLVFFLPLLVLSATLVPDWDGRTWLLLALSGVVGVTLADTLFFASLNRLGAGLSAVVDCLYYPSMVAVGFLLLGESVTARDLAGGALVILGILVGSLGPPPPGATRRTILAGVLLGATAMGLVAIGVALVDDVLAREPLLPATAYRLLFGMLALVPLNLASARHRQTMASLVRPSGLWRYALPASIVGGALAMWAWLAGFAMADIARAAVLNQLSTIWIFVLAVPILGEELTARRVVALAVSFGGALLVLTG